MAAAIHAGAQVIVTRNLRDFPGDALGPLGIEAQHPDAFLTGLHEAHREALGRIVTGIARAWGSDATALDVLDRLTVDAPRTAQDWCARRPETPPHRRERSTGRVLARHGLGRCGVSCVRSSR
ncbi:MAG: hypothetical protein QM675_03030 [Protaetiibacter sp.]